MTQPVDIGKHPRLKNLVMKHGRFPESVADVLTRFAEHFDRHPGEDGAGTGVAKVGPHPTNGPAAKLRRARPGTVTPAQKYKDPIIKVLMRFPHGTDGLPPYSLPAKRVIAEVGDLMKSQLNETDLGRLNDTDLPRWENKCQWGRQLLVDEGLLKKREESGFGIWALSPRGLEYGKALTKRK
jgi:hypothetical protein